MLKLIMYNVNGVSLNNTFLEYKAYGVIKTVNDSNYVWYILDPNISEYLNLVKTSLKSTYE
jgi:hypothetical protein